MNIFLIILYSMLGFSFALSPAQGFDVQVLRVVVPIATLVWLAFGASKKRIMLPHGWIAMLFFVLLLWMCGSLFYSPVPSWTLRKLFFFLTLAPVLLLLFDVFSRQREARYALARAIVVGGSIIGVIGLMQFSAQFLFSHDRVVQVWEKLTPFFLGGTFAQSVAQYNSWYVHIAGRDFLRAVAFFPDPHVFSFYLGMILPFAWALYMHTKKSRYLISFGILFLADLLTFSRGGEMALLAGGLVSIALFLPRASTQFKHLLLAGLFLFLGGFVVIGGVVVERFVSSFDPQDTSATSRIILWRDAYDTIKEMPVRGVGLGAYAYHSNPRADYRMPIYAHNLYLDIATEVGLLGAVLWGLLFVLSLLVLWRHRQEPLAQAAFVSFVIYLTHSLFDTALFSVHIFLLLLFLLALSIFYEHQR